MPRKYNPQKPNKRYSQELNTKDLRLDLTRKAKPPGWRLSKTGNWYMELRQNRTDKRGTNL